LLTGLLETDAGTISIDGIPITRVEIQSWRRTLGYVPQEVILLHDTIRRNIALGNTGVTDADLEYALQAAGALQFVQRLPNGLDQVVGERGMALSGGQRQRISIARAMLNRPQLLILDEPTTALDPDSEQAICETLRGLKGSVTIVAISHQSAIQAVADIVFKVHEGRVYQYDNQRHALPAEDCGERRTMSPDLEEILEGFDD
jgi:ATP-binding cassette subfamily C protein